MRVRRWSSCGLTTQRPRRSATRRRERARSGTSEAKRGDNRSVSSSAQMIGTVLSGRYRLESKLGSGGMSTVYLAEDETLDRPVAVKVLHREISDDSDQLERFRLEAR